MLPLRALAAHESLGSGALVWLRDPAQVARELEYTGAEGSSARSASSAAPSREVSVVLRISLAPEGVVARSREDTERRLSLVARAHLRRWRAVEILRLPPSLRDTMTVLSPRSLGTTDRDDNDQQPRTQCKSLYSRAIVPSREFFIPFRLLQTCGEMM